MTTTMSTPTATAVERHTGGRAVLVCGLSGLVAYVVAAVLFGDALAGSGTAEEAAGALDDAAGAVRASAALLALAVLLLSRVVVELGARTSVSHRPAARLVVPFGVLPLVLLAVAFWSLAGAATVGPQLFDSAVTATSAEVGLVALNTLTPLAALVAAGFFAVLATFPELSRWLRISAGVGAVGLVLPMTGWAFLYAVPLWLAAAGVWAARTSRG